MADAPIIPPVIWQRIAAWLKAGGTGQITLDAHRGSVQQAWINERIGKDADSNARAVDVHGRSSDRGAAAV
jgi:hypothetical protein